jgi:DNA gyrase subunit A
MNDLGLGPRSKHRKCAKIAGDTSGNYHPHGEAVIYPTLVRLAQDWTLRSTLIDGQGNFGSTDGDPPAAMRYTEARMTGVAMELMADLEYDTVDLIPNYDETRTEPTVFPSKFPNLLVNGSTGIAGRDGVQPRPAQPAGDLRRDRRVIDQPDVSLAELMDIVPGPDFPTGGTICGRDGIVDGYRAGRGKICLRAKVDVEEQKGGKAQPLIVIDETPYNVISQEHRGERRGGGEERGTSPTSARCNDESGRQHKCRIVSS